MQTLRVIGVLVLVGAGILVYAVWGGRGRMPQAYVPPPSTPVTVANISVLQPVQEIELQYHQPDLPPGPGRDEFATQCVICHSPRYVLNQPRFPRKVWTAEVHKMVVGYGAPILPEQEKQIVDYLVSWHGPQDLAPAASTEGSK